MLDFQIIAVDDNDQLYISPIIEDWAMLAPYRVDTIIDLEGGLDHCIPTVPDTCLYIYFPIFDDNLPNRSKLRGIARLAAALIRAGHVVLSHCGMGFNRSALVAGLILIELGLPGRDAVARLRERRPGALFNETFAAYLESIDATGTPT